MIADSVVSLVVSLEIMWLASTLHVRWTHQEANLPNGVASEPHEYIPFLLVPNCAISLGDFVRIHYFLEASQRLVVWLDGFGEG